MSDSYSLDQLPFGIDSFADNPEPRCPCVLLLDVSGSMQGQPVSELNKGLKYFKEDLSSDELAKKRVEVAIVTFGGSVQVKNNFQTALSFIPPELSADGDTPMGRAILEGLQLLKHRKEEYKANGISFYRPWIFLITDGEPTDEWQTAAALIKEGEQNKSFAFFTVAVQNANINNLKQIAVREPLKLQGLKFRDLFQWLSNSMKAVSSSTPGITVQLATPSGWADV